MAQEVYEAVVQKVVPTGMHGPFAVATCDGVGTVTFALTREVWGEEDFPEAGNVVLLSKIRAKRAGWRAYSAKFVTPQNSSSTRKEQ